MRKYWYHTLSGVVAALGWTCIFAYALLRALAGFWWMMLAVLITTILAGLFNTALAMPKQAKKEGAKKKPPGFIVRRPGVH